MITAADQTAESRRRCGCCGQPRDHLAELSETPGVYICRRCAAWAIRRAGAIHRHEESDHTPEGSVVDRQALYDEMNAAYVNLHRILQGATSADLRRPSAGTRWTNQQLLFHMVFGYLVVLRLLPLVHLFGRLPDRASRRFAAILNATTRPFHVINYLGSVGGGTALAPTRIDALLTWTIASLNQHLAAEHEAALHRTMHFPVGWDPFFKDVMTLADVYHFGTQHFDYHREQLTLFA